MSKVPKETQEQIWLIQWSQQPKIRNIYPDLKYLFHIANERTDKVQAAILKKMGVKRGVPDLFLPVHRGKFHGLFIEMKREKGGTASEDQKWWCKSLLENGYAVSVCKGWEAAVQVLEWYLNLEG